MRDSLMQTYLPLVIWVGLGIMLGRLLSPALPQLMGRSPWGAELPHDEGWYWC